MLANKCNHTPGGGFIIIYIYEYKNWLVEIAKVVLDYLIQDC